MKLRSMSWPELAQLVLSSPPSNIALATYWEMAGKAFAGETPMESPALSHACEYGSGLMLRLHPSPVRMEWAARVLRPAADAWIGWEDEVAYRGVAGARRTEYLLRNSNRGVEFSMG
jgi:creatinine amidohydrolase